MDIYIDDHLIVSNELKDKEYSESDVRHAADKVLQAGGNRMLFIEGPRGKATSNFSTSLIREYAEKNFMLVILPASAFISIITPLIENTDSHEFVRFMLDTAHETKFKEEVIDYLDTLYANVHLHSMILYKYYRNNPP